jgi:tetratricopeptide (TPR) repeat protein
MHGGLPVVLAGSFAALLGLFGVRSAVRNPVWGNNEALFGATLRDHPESFRSHWFQAVRFLERGDTAGSLPHWARAFEIYPESATLLTAYATVLLEAGELREADRIAARVLALRPHAPGGLFVKGRIDVALGRPAEAAGHIAALRRLGFAGMAGELEGELGAVQPRQDR